MATSLFSSCFSILPRGYRDVPQSWPPFFRPVGAPLAYQLTLNVPLRCPPFSIFRKILHFQDCFGQKFSSQGANFQNFCSQDPSFYKENQLPIPYLWHTPTQKKLSASTPGILLTYSTCKQHLDRSLNIYINSYLYGAVVGKGERKVEKQWGWKNTSSAPAKSEMGKIDKWR